MASSYIKVYTKDSNTNEAVLLRTYGGNRSDVKWECNAYRDLDYIKEKHPHLNDTEIDNLYIVCYNVLIAIKSTHLREELYYEQRRFKKTIR